MKTHLHHVALSVTDLDWYEDFLKEVFEMTIRKKSGEKPYRKIWFHQGIQLNEVQTLPIPGDLYNHLGIAADDTRTILSRASAYGCSPLPNGDNWFKLPNGLKVELL